MRPWLNPAELADVIGGHMRQSAVLRLAAERVNQPLAA